MLILIGIPFSFHVLTFNTCVSSMTHRISCPYKLNLKDVTLQL